MADEEQDDSETTLVQSGRAAFTFKDMAAFVHDIEARPLARLLTDLDGLMALPEAKFPLVAMVLRKRMRPGAAERESILAALLKLQTAAADPVVRHRAHSLLAKPQE